MTAPALTGEHDTPVRDWLTDMRFYFPDTRVTFLRSPDGTTERGQRGAEGVQPIIKEKTK